MMIFPNPLFSNKIYSQKILIANE